MTQAADSLGGCLLATGVTRGCRLMGAAVRGADAEGALGLHARMRAAGVPPDAFTYTILMKVVPSRLSAADASCVLTLAGAAGRPCPATRLWQAGSAAISALALQSLPAVPPCGLFASRTLIPTSTVSEHMTDAIHVQAA